MGITIREEIDYIYESSLYLTVEYNSGLGVFYQGPESLTASLLESYDVPRDLLDDMFEDTQTLYNHLRDTLKEDQESIEKYFISHFPHAFSIGRLLFLYCHGDEHDVDRIVAEYKAMNTKEKLRMIDNRIRTIFNPTSDNASLAEVSERDIYSFIAQQEVEEATKWKLGEFVRNFDQYMDGCSRLMKKVIAALRDQKSLTDRMITLGMKNIKQMVKDDTISKGFKEYYHLTFDMEGDIMIYPQLVTSNGISMMSDEKDNIYLYIATLYDQVSLITEKYAFNTQTVANDVKIMGDRRKFEILLKLRERPMYGQEIAESMELTTATVSHHMSQLLERQLVVIEKVDHRVYYAINKEQFEKLLKNLRKLFLD